MLGWIQAAMQQDGVVFLGGRADISIIEIRLNYEKKIFCPALFCLRFNDGIFSLSSNNL